MNFKRVALKDKVESTALQIIDGPVSDVGRALREVSPAQGQALVEAMPETRIASRLLDLAEFIEEVDGPLAEPTVEFRDEIIMFQLQDAIYHIIRLASLDKLRKVLTHFINTYISLKETAQLDAEIATNHTLDNGVVIIDESAPPAVIQVNPSTHLALTQHAKTEIIDDKESDTTIIGSNTVTLEAYARYLIEHIKYDLLRKLIYGLFYAVRENERLEDVQNILGIATRLLLDEDGSLITPQELAADPERHDELVRILREKEEEEILRKEVALRTRLDRDKEAKRFLDEHRDELAKFDKVDERIANGEEGTSVEFEEEDAKDREVIEEDEEEKARRPEDDEELDFED